MSIPSQPIPEPCSAQLPRQFQNSLGCQKCKFTFKAPSHCPTSVTAGPGTISAGKLKAQRGHSTVCSYLFIFTTEPISLGADCNKSHDLQEVKVQENIKCSKMKIRFQPTYEHFLLEMPQVTELAEQHMKAQRPFFTTFFTRGMNCAHCQMYCTSPHLFGDFESSWQTSRPKNQQTSE